MSRRARTFCCETAMLTQYICSVLFCCTVHITSDEEIPVPLFSLFLSFSLFFLIFLIFLVLFFLIFLFLFFLIFFPSLSLSLSLFSSSSIYQSSFHSFNRAPAPLSLSYAEPQPATTSLQLEVSSREVVTTRHDSLPSASQPPNKSLA